MENSAGSVVNSIEVQIDNFLEHFKRTSKAMEEEGDEEHDESTLVRRSSSTSRRRADGSRSRPTSMGVFEEEKPSSSSKTEGYDCLLDADGLLLDSNSEGRYIIVWNN